MPCVYVDSISNAVVFGIILCFVYIGKYLTDHVLYCVYHLHVFYIVSNDPTEINKEFRSNRKTQRRVRIVNFQ